MSKAKTHSGAKKRFKLAGGGRIKCKHANKSHILTKMTTKRKRQLRGTDHIDPADLNRVERMLRIR